MSSSIYAFNRTNSPTKVFPIKLGSQILIISFVLSIAVFLPFLKPVIYLSLMGLTMLGPVYTIQALTLSWLTAMSTPGFGESTGGSSLRFLLLFISFASVIFHQVYLKSKSPPRIVYLAMIFGLGLGFISTVSSYALDVSLLKILSFSVGISTVLWATSVVKNPEVLKKWYTGLFVVTLVMSIPFLFSYIGYLRNGAGFQGIFAHPQIMGVFAGIGTAWLFTRIFLNNEKGTGLLFFFFVALAFIFLSEARTGLIAMVLGVAFTIFMAPKLSQSSRGIFILYSAGTLILILIFLAPSARGFFQDFLTKRQDPGDFVQAFQNSRGELMVRSWVYFQENPIFGVGFGLPGDETLLQISRDPVLGLPTGASVEKGFFFTGLLEEVGLLGTSLFVIFIFALIKLTIKSKNPSRYALLFTPLFTNIGEATLFSFGGNGMIVWLFIAYAVAAKRT